MIRQQRLALVVAILSSALVALKQSIVSVALPGIERDLGSGLGGQTWILSAYLLTTSALLLTGGSLAGPARATG